MPNYLVTAIASDSVDLVVTSPPYPMIEMWDEMFCTQNSAIRTALQTDGMKAKILPVIEAE